MTAVLKNDTAAAAAVIIRDESACTAAALADLLYKEVDNKMTLQVGSVSFRTNDSRPPWRETDRERHTHNNDNDRQRVLLTYTRQSHQGFGTGTYRSYPRRQEMSDR